MNLEINKELVLSTSHMPQGLSEQMLAEDDLGMIYYDLREDGYLIYVMSDASEYPESIRQAVKLAYDNGCKWLHFDPDGDEVSGLPTWKWWW